MAYKISDDCISCGACAAECPVEAIHEGVEEARQPFFISVYTLSACSSIQSMNTP